MARRSSILEDVMDMPWPVGVVLAILCYPIALLLAGYLSGTKILVPLASVTLTIWPLFSVMFLFASLISFIKSLQKKQLFINNKTLPKIQSLSWRQFEFYVGEMFRRQGYFVVETPEGPDGGVDLVLRKDGEKTYVQCKHWKSHKVSVGKVRELLGSMAAGGADHGVFVTSGRFTSSAATFGKQHRIKLINGKDLEYLIRVSPSENALQTDTSADVPECPYCKSTMIKRTAKKGRNPGKQFWGCSKFPQCRGTRNY